MARIFVYSIVSLLAITAVQGRTIAKYNGNPKMSEKSRLNLVECAREYNVDIDELENIDLEEERKNPTNETCAIACALKKELHIQDRPLYEVISNLVKHAYDDGFNSQYFSRREAESLVKGCYILKPNECEFIKCVGIGKPPLSEIFEYLSEKLNEAIIEIIAKAIGDAINS